MNQMLLFFSYTSCLAPSWAIWTRIMEIAVFGMENRCFVMHEMEKVLLPTTTTDDGTGMKLRSSL